MKGAIREKRGLTSHDLSWPTSPLGVRMKIQPINVKNDPDA